MEYKMIIAGLERYLPLCPISEDTYIAGFVMFNDVELTTAVATELLARAPEFDVIVTAESKGIPLAYEMARQNGNSPYIVARKGAKAYMQDVVEVSVDSITTDHRQILCLGKAERDIINGKRILVVDDVVSTGESLAAVDKLIEVSGGNIVGQCAVLAEGDAMKREDIFFLNELPLFNADGTPKK